MSDVASRAGFGQMSDPAVGELLAVVAASVPPGGRILELGTGVGVGTAWLAEGARDADVQIVTIELDAALVELARSVPWPDSVEFVVGDALALLPSLGTFDLIFADAVAGKWHGLDRTLQALRPGGTLVVDDMNPPSWVDEEHERKTREVRATLLGHGALVATELAWATGVIVCTKRWAAEGIPDQAVAPAAVDELLAGARRGLDRVGPGALAGEVAAGALVVDTRPADQRARDGALPGAVVIDRNVLEWRLDPTSPHRIPQVTDHGQRVIVVCNEGYASSLAAATLRELGLGRATDLEGGFQAWIAFVEGR